MNTFEQIEYYLDNEQNQELIDFCVGKDSELSKEIYKQIIGRKTTNARNLANRMSHLQTGETRFGSGMKKVKKRYCKY